MKDKGLIVKAGRETKKGRKKNRRKGNSGSRYFHVLVKYSCLFQWKNVTISFFLVVENSRQGERISMNCRDEEAKRQKKKQKEARQKKIVKENEREREGERERSIEPHDQKHETMINVRSRENVEFNSTCAQS